MTTEKIFNIVLYIYLYVYLDQISLICVFSFSELFGKWTYEHVNCSLFFSFQQMFLSIQKQHKYSFRSNIRQIITLEYYSFRNIKKIPEVKEVLICKQSQGPGPLRAYSAHSGKTASMYWQSCCFCSEVQKGPWLGRRQLSLLLRK